MKGLSISLLLALLLLHLAPAEVAAQHRPAQVIAPLGDLLIFQSPTGGLWRTDGTEAGTFRLARTCLRNYDCFPILGESGGRIFFLVEIARPAPFFQPSRQLWSTDGSRQGTLQLTDFPEGLHSPVGAEAYYLPAPGTGLFFFVPSTTEAGRPKAGQELWVSDGTPAGTRIVTDLAPGPADGAGQLLAEIEGGILFEGITAEHGYQLWRSDGTTTGTKLVRDFWPDWHGGAPRVLATLDGQAFVTFQSWSMLHHLWVSDGTAGGTQFLYAVDPVTPSPGGETSLCWYQAVVAESQVFLRACTRTSAWRLFRSDGTTAGTYPIRDSFADFGTLGSSVLFTSWDEEHGEEPWISNGTLGGTHVLADLLPGPADSSPSSYFEAGSLAYFLTGQYLGWVTDGTPRGTRPFATLTYDWPRTEPLFAPGPDARVFFVVATAPNHDLHELWVTPAVGGPPGSTTQLRGPSFMPFGLVGTEAVFGAPLGDLFFFVGQDHEHGIALWRSDATPSGTYPLAILEPQVQPGPVTRVKATPSGAGTGEVVLTWDPPDLAHRYSYGIMVSSPESDEYQPLNVWSTTTTISGLLPGTPYVFRVRAWGDFGPGPWAEAAATPLPAVITPCVPGEDSLCLHGSRFEVKAFYRDHIHDGWGAARTAPMSFSDDSGTFWFFTPNNLELTVKVLDARVVNGYFWSFFGGLTSLETWITVTDTEAQTNVTFHKGANEMCGRADVAAFPRPAFEALGVGGTCEPRPDHLCLTGNRYRVEVTWRDQRSGHTGVGHALPGTEDSGFFWFFDDENVELLVKVLDATVVNGYVWVFFGSMTDVEYALTVTDTRTGERVLYVNPPGALCGQADVAAF